MPAAMQALSLLALLLALLVQAHKYWRYAPALPHMPAAMQALSLLALLLALLVQMHQKKTDGSPPDFFVFCCCSN
jgi:hypothetical protein